MGRAREEPGEAWVFGYNTDILGCVVERASGQPLDEFIRTRITAPLGMRDTYFFLPSEKRGRLTAVYGSGQDGKAVRAPEGARGQGHYVDGPRRNFSGGAGLVSTARDYARFLEMIRNGGALDGVRILAPKTVALMTTNVVGTLRSSAGLGWGLAFETTDVFGANGREGVRRGFPHVRVHAPPASRVEEEAMKRLYVLCTVLLIATALGCAQEHGAPTAPSPVGIDAPTASANAEKVRHVPRDYTTIQAAIDAAGEGGIIQVGEGTYHENLVITTSALRLYGSNGAVIEGAGTGTAIHVLGTAGQPVTNVEISGFEVRTFEKGIVAELGVGIQIHRNDVHHINNLGSLTTGDGEGIMLWTTRDSEVTENAVHQNSYTGIALRGGSTLNTVRSNRVYENGNPAVVPTGMSNRGTGILITGEGTNGNRIVENEILRNYDRGILITRPAGTTPITGTVVAQNRIHESQRSGIAVMLAAAGNFILQNDARGNNLSGQAPCYQCNLNDLSSAGLGGNTWERNLGAFNLIDACGQ